MSNNNYSPLIPWSTCNIPNPLQLEMLRRKNNRSFNHQPIENWNSNGGSWQNAMGPMRSFLRICSNGMGRDGKKPGFILNGGTGFYQTYGFSSVNQNGNQQVLGYTPSGIAHTVDYDKNSSHFPIHVPTPNVQKLETILQKELFRRAFINWTCFSPAQLEYMTPYFLVPGITVMIEFGWNHFNPNSLIDLTNEQKLSDYFFKNPYPLYNDNVLGSNGNYDVVYGIISNWEWSVDGNKINCMTEVTSKDRLYAGMQLSSVTAEKIDLDTDSKKSEFTLFKSLRQICDPDTGFIKNIKSIATAKSLETAVTDVNMTNTQLWRLIRFGTKPNAQRMKESYWRGVFYGRDETILKKSENMIFSWDPAKDGDFDKKGENLWVNMGFLVELMNRSLPKPSTNDGAGFFEVNVDESVIGAHPNLISTDGSVLLIPNAFAPKYSYGWQVKPTAGKESQYSNQFLFPTNRKITNKPNGVDDVFWNADFQLSKIFGHGNTPRRDNIDEVINGIRYLYSTERQRYSFPFSVQESVKIENRDELATYDPYFYGYFKDLYFNINEFIRLVNDSSIKTYDQLYTKIFESINKAAGNFWEFALVPNDNSQGLTVVDKKMISGLKDKSTPWYFDYADSDQLMLSLAFKPIMSDAQTCKVLFGSTNNPDSKTIIRTDNDLLDYKFDDRILSKIKTKSPTVLPPTVPESDKKTNQVRAMQQQDALPTMYPFTIMVDDKTYYRRLVMPDADLLSCLLDDQDLNRNQRYGSIQPITVEISLQGIGGLRTFMSFLIRNLPNPYNHKDVAYRIVDVKHVLQDGKWVTTLKAGIVPLHGYIKEKLNIKD